MNSNLKLVVMCCVGVFAVVVFVLVTQSIWGVWRDEPNTPTLTNSGSEFQDSQNMVLHSECLAALTEREIIEEEFEILQTHQYPNETSRDQDLETLKGMFITIDEKIRSVCPESYVAEK